MRILLVVVGLGGCGPIAGSVDDGSAGGSADVCAARGAHGISVRRAGVLVQQESVSEAATVTAVRAGEFDLGVNAVTWTVEARAPALPSTLLQVGDAVHLDVYASLTTEGFSSTVTQLVAITKGSEVLLFGLSGQSRFVITDSFTTRGVSAPVVIDRGGVACETEPPTGSPCGRRVERARVSVGGSSITLAAPSTGAIGAFDVTLAAFEGVVDRGMCDGTGFTELVGVRVR